MKTNVSLNNFYKYCYWHQVVLISSVFHMIHNNYQNTKKGFPHLNSSSIVLVFWGKRLGFATGTWHHFVCSLKSSNSGATSNRFKFESFLRYSFCRETEMEHLGYVVWSGDLCICTLLLCVHSNFPSFSTFLTPKCPSIGPQNGWKVTKGFVP